MDHTLIEPLFQPIFDRAGRVFAYEALLRLKGRATSPARLVKRFERTGRIVELDLAMVRRVSEILAANGSRPRVAINVSVVTVERAGVDYVRALETVASATRLLIVELTETAPITNHAALRSFYAECRHRGFSVALDDCRPEHLYGSPFFICSLQPQFVKLDGRFLQACYREGKLAGLAEIVQAARVVSAPVIAEFISSPELHKFAFQMGADYAQGYELGMPAPLPARTSADAANEGTYRLSFMRDAV